MNRLMWVPLKCEGRSTDISTLATVCWAVLRRSFTAMGKRMFWTPTFAMGTSRPSREACTSASAAV